MNRRRLLLTAAAAAAAAPFPASAQDSLEDWLAAVERNAGASNAAT